MEEAAFDLVFEGGHDLGKGLSKPAAQHVSNMGLRRWDNGKHSSWLEHICNRILREIGDKTGLDGAKSEMDLGTHLNYVGVIHVCKRSVSVAVLQGNRLLWHQEQGRLAIAEGRTGRRFFNPVELAYTVV